MAPFTGSGRYPSTKSSYDVDGWNWTTLVRCEYLGELLRDVGLPGARRTVEDDLALVAEQLDYIVEEGPVDQQLLGEVLDRIGLIVGSRLLVRVARGEREQEAAHPPRIAGEERLDPPPETVVGLDMNSPPAGLCRFRQSQDVEQPLLAVLTLVREDSEVALRMRDCEQLHHHALAEAADLPSRVVQNSVDAVGVVALSVAHVAEGVEQSLVRRGLLGGPVQAGHRSWTTVTLRVPDLAQLTRVLIGQRAVRQERGEEATVGTVLLISSARVAPSTELLGEGDKRIVPGYFRRRSVLALRERDERLDYRPRLGGNGDDLVAQIHSVEPVTVVEEAVQELAAGTADETRILAVPTATGGEHAEVGQGVLLDRDRGLVVPPAANLARFDPDSQTVLIDPHPDAGRRSVFCPVDPGIGARPAGLPIRTVGESPEGSSDGLVDVRRQLARVAGEGSQRPGVANEIVVLEGLGIEAEGAAVDEDGIDDDRVLALPSAGDPLDPITVGIEVPDASAELEVPIRGLARQRESRDVLGERGCTSPVDRPSPIGHRPEVRE
jgi:hypothetical protein